MTAPGAGTKAARSREQASSSTISLTFAHFAMVGRLGGIPIVSLAAIVTIASGRIVLTVVANSAGHSSRQLVQFQIEATTSGVSIALAH